MLLSGSIYMHILDIVTLKNGLKYRVKHAVPKHIISGAPGTPLLFLQLVLNIRPTTHTYKHLQLVTTPLPTRDVTPPPSLPPSYLSLLLSLLPQSQQYNASGRYNSKAVTVNYTLKPALLSSIELIAAITEVNYTGLQLLVYVVSYPLNLRSKPGLIHLLKSTQFTCV